MALVKALHQTGLSAGCRLAPSTTNDEKRRSGDQCQTPELVRLIAHHTADFIRSTCGDRRALTSVRSTDDRSFNFLFLINAFSQLRHSVGYYHQRLCSEKKKSADTRRAVDSTTTSTMMCTCLVVVLFTLSAGCQPDISISRFRGSGDHRSMASLKPVGISSLASGSDNNIQQLGGTGNALLLWIKSATLATNTRWRYVAAARTLIACDSVGPDQSSIA